MRIVLVTGISGSGKSIAINVLEDDGYFCIDNLPIRFLHEVITSLREAGHEKVAVSVDARSGESVGDLRELASGLGRYGHDVKIIFLNARTDTLVQRYSETRRRHPMSLRGAGPDATGTLVESIERERELMSALEDLGVSLDTSDLHPNVRGRERHVRHQRHRLQAPQEVARGVRMGRRQRAVMPRVTSSASALC